jgi:dihydrodipicolinate synthase/N-acetylneuraminate lyase
LYSTPNGSMAVTCVTYFHARRQLDPDQARSGFSRLANAATDAICPLATTATIAAIPAALTATLIAFMIDSSHNRFIRVTNPVGPARQHAILFLVAVDHGRSCEIVALRVDEHRCLEDC